MGNPSLFVKINSHPLAFHLCFERVEEATISSTFALPLKKPCYFDFSDCALFLQRIRFEMIDSLRSTRKLYSMCKVSYSMFSANSSYFFNKHHPTWIDGHCKLSSRICPRHTHETHRTDACEICMAQ